MFTLSSWCTFQNNQCMHGCFTAYLENNVFLYLLFYLSILCLENSIKFFQHACKTNISTQVIRKLKMDSDNTKENELRLKSTIKEMQHVKKT